MNGAWDDAPLHENYRGYVWFPKIVAAAQLSFEQTPVAPAFQPQRQPLLIDLANPA